tara:strand:- start:46291 stop:50313 length:4023 start_codon:yes stop_codon:yes gene_type:complete
MHYRLKIIFAINTLLIGILFLFSVDSKAQSVSVGQGSYTTILQDGNNVPSSAAGQPVTPKVSSEFNQLIQTNDYWSNLIYPFTGSIHLNQTHIHPLTLESTQSGFKLGYLNTNTTFTNSYAYTAKNKIEISISGVTSTRTSTHSYGDWTFSAKMEFENASLIATTGHGLPYTFFDVMGGDIEITSSSSFSVWHNVNEVIGLTIDGVHYALFAPTGSTWSGTQTLTSSLNGKGFLSVAVLPDSSPETLEFYRKHAYAQVKNSTVSWDYNESSADLTSTFTYKTILRDSAVGNIDETLTALYRHQWTNTADVLTNYTYVSPRGEMKVFEGNSFSTTSRFSGILPSLPDEGNYDRIQLLEFVQQVASEDLPIDNTYDNGKQMGRFVEVVHIADQLGAINERDYLLTELKLRLESWFTAGGEQEYYYNDTWNTLIGYPDSFGSSREINDHHFHAAYAIKAAATIAQYDSSWASQENWGGMVNLIIQDANNWNREDELFPFLRNFDAYAGHAWASGHGDHSFGNTRPGNNQESSSESINFASATLLWGEMTGQQDIRDLGIFLYTNETEAIDQYWFDIDNEVFPEDFTKKALGRVWGNGGDHNTWFSSEPEFVHGINFLPINAGSFYLGKNPEYIIENYNELVAERVGLPIHWKDVFWQYLSMSDADQALSYYNSDQNYDPFDGETKAHTHHWLYNMKEMGHYNTEVTADVPTYAVFVSQTDDTTYVAFNADPIEKMITFSDGFTMNVPARSLNSYSTVPSETMVSAPSPTKDSENVISIFSDTYASATDVTFNVDEGQSTITTLEVINGNNTLKYDSLDFQSTIFEILQNVSTRSTFHVDYWTENSTELAVYLISEDQSEEKFDFTVTTNAWQSIEIPLIAFSEVDLFTISKIKFVGNGTVYIDNLYFSGDTPVPTGPSLVAPTPDIDPDNVISIFSDTYTNILGTDFNPNWEQSTITSIVSIADNSMLKYENLNYQGTHFGDTLDVNDMGWFHLDYWTENATQLEVYLISPGPLETPFEITIKNNDWQRIDIPLSEFSEVVNLSEVYQIKIVGNGTVYFDNFYFGKNAELTVAPTPIHDQDKVVSLFSDAYTNNNTVDTWSAPWDQATHEDIVINGNNLKFYSDLNFAGIEFIAKQIDATDLTHFRFDLMTQLPTDDPVKFTVRLVDFGANGSWSGGDDVEDDLIFDRASTPSLVSNQWISFDLPIDDFVDLSTRKNLSQLLFLTSGGLSEVYIDNIYFYGDKVLNSNESDNDEIPTKVELLQNYPNPFNPSTNIEFGIPEASHVSLTIFNALGQKVATLANSRFMPGSHSITWDASRAPSGVYFYRLVTGNNISTKKMLLIK